MVLGGVICYSNAVIEEEEAIIIIHLLGQAPEGRKK
jgi:hypothetical protein